MRDFDEEPAQLQAVGELLDQCEAVVTFNGKHFDLPLLETRFIMVRQPSRLGALPHLDLLPSARRLWAHRLDSCALSSLEAELLGVRRSQADMPGWLIPSLYVEYTRTGDAREIPRVFYHNAQDILSLVTLAAHQCGLMSMPPSVAAGVPGEDLYGVGRILHELGELDRAEAAYTQAAQTCQTLQVREMTIRDLAYLLKRQGRRGDALSWWLQLAEAHDAVYACEELAKHYEWHDPDLSLAIAWTQHGIALVERWPASSRRRDSLADLSHRLERLSRKREGGAGG
jgi:tetratricopeptide (TPR) repeat protein